MYVGCDFLKLVMFVISSQLQVVCFWCLCTGQKGIGFKSVFRVTDFPQIFSNGYAFGFDRATHKDLGYVLPTWVGDQPLPQELQLALQHSQLLIGRQGQVNAVDPPGALDNQQEGEPLWRGSFCNAMHEGFFLATTCNYGSDISCSMNLLALVMLLGSGALRCNI